MPRITSYNVCYTKLLRSAAVLKEASVERVNNQPKLPKETKNNDTKIDIAKYIDCEQPENKKSVRVKADIV